MSVYVDTTFVMESRNAQARFVGQRTGHQWCHMWADTEKELHAMARKMGLKREWFQNHGTLAHYDLVPTKRIAAIKNGAREYSLRIWFKRQRVMEELVG